MDRGLRDHRGHRGVPRTSTRLTVAPTVCVSWSSSGRAGCAAPSGRRGRDSAAGPAGSGPGRHAGEAGALQRHQQPVAMERFRPLTALTWLTFSPRGAGAERARGERHGRGSGRRSARGSPGRPAVHVRALQAAVRGGRTVPGPPRGRSGRVRRGPSTAAPPRRPSSRKVRVSSPTANGSLPPQDSSRNEPRSPRSGRRWCPRRTGRRPAAPPR